MINDDKKVPGLINSIFEDNYLSSNRNEPAIIKDIFSNNCRRLIK